MEQETTAVAPNIMEWYGGRPANINFRSYNNPLVRLGQVLDSNFSHSVYSKNIRFNNLFGG